MIDRKSLFSTYLHMTPEDLELVLGIIADARDCVTVTTSFAHQFEKCDNIVLSGFTNSDMGGVWPRWMLFLHIPERVRFMVQTVCDHFDYRFGPRRYRVIGATSGTSLTLAGR